MVIIAVAALIVAVLVGWQGYANARAIGRLEGKRRHRKAKIYPDIGA